MNCSICNKEITEYGCPTCDPIVFRDKIIQEVESSDLSEAELKMLGFGLICRGLDKHLAESMKSRQPGSVIIPDELNPGDFTLMSFGEGVQCNNNNIDDEPVEVEGAEFDD